MIVRPSRGTGSPGPARRRTVARIAALACAPAILLVPGCSFSTGGDTLDSDKLEREIAKGIKEQLSIDATVTCPDDVKLTAGDVFECEASSSGSTATVTVTQRDDKGNVDWKLNAGTSTTPTGTTGTTGTTP